MPECLLELWTEYGFGLYGDGLLQVIDPDLYRENLWGWLMREEGEEDMTRLPIALSAFGQIFYYRKLSEEDEDVSFVDPHTSTGGDIVWSLRDFFNEWCCDSETTSSFLDAPLFNEAALLKGPLQANQIFCFVPSLRLGGRRSVSNIDKGDAVTHLDFLLQLTRE